jgi:hypothetical protein
MVCLDCGRPATKFFSYCAHCRSQYRQHPAKQAGFWDKFITKSNRYTRQYDFARSVGAQELLPGQRPLNRLLTPFLALRKLFQ